MFHVSSGIIKQQLVLGLDVCKTCAHAFAFAYFAFAVCCDNIEHSQNLTPQICLKCEYHNQLIIGNYPH